MRPIHVSRMLLIYHRPHSYANVFGDLCQHSVRSLLTDSRPPSHPYPVQCDFYLR